MRINELLTESQQLDEGPIAQAIGKGVGKVAGGLGAVAGGVAGAWDAAKKGFQSGRATVAGEPDPNAAQGGGAAPQQQAPAQGGQQQAPAQGGGGGGGAAPQQQAAGGAPAQGGQQQAPAQEPAATAADANAQGPKGTAPAKAQTGAAAAAMQKTADANQGANQEKVNQTAYAQVKAQVNQLDKKGKQNIMKLLQKSLAQPDPKAAQGKPAAGAAPAAGAQPAPAQEPAAQAAPAPAAKAGGNYDAQTGQPLSDKAKADAEFDASPQGQAIQAKVDAMPAAEPDTPAAAPAARTQGGGKVAGQQSQTPGAIKKRAARAAKKGAAGEPAPGAAPSQAEIDADRDRIMGNFTDSVIRPGTSLEEMLARKVQVNKQKMFETSLAKGEFRVFKK